MENGEIFLLVRKNLSFFVERSIISLTLKSPAVVKIDCRQTERGEKK